MNDIFHPPVVVRPPTRGAHPYRRVEIYGRSVGKAFTAADVAEFIRRAGVDDPDLDDPDLVAWRGGDRTVWEPEDGTLVPEDGTPVSEDGAREPEDGAREPDR